MRRAFYWKKNPQLVNLYRLMSSVFGSILKRKILVLIIDYYIFLKKRINQSILLVKVVLNYSIILILNYYLFFFIKINKLVLDILKLFLNNYVKV